VVAGAEWQASGWIGHLSIPSRRLENVGFCPTVPYRFGWGVARQKGHLRVFVRP
jgi:hypothetical protein